MLQIGARNMQNYALLHAAGESMHPVLLKRGMMATVEELLMAAEYILSHGNRRVILCERGIRTFETSTRNTTDINAIPVLKSMTHLPVVLDPSHSTGQLGVRDCHRPGGHRRRRRWVDGGGAHQPGRGALGWGAVAQAGALRRDGEAGRRRGAGDRAQHRPGASLRQG